VLYIGDFELRGPADQIEANTRRYIEQHAGRIFTGVEWTKIALTEAQVAEHDLEGLVIEKTDKRYTKTGGKTYRAVECEALGQGAIVRMVRSVLDEERRWRGLDQIEAAQERERTERGEIARLLASLGRTGSR
jgi:hypothetical protein